MIHLTPSDLTQIDWFDFVFVYQTRSYAALRAADLDWIVGPGYSLGRGHSGEKPWKTNMEPWKTMETNQILIPQVMMDDLPLPLMKGTIQGGLPLRADVV